MILLEKLFNKYLNKTISFYGWIYEKRIVGKLVFLIIRQQNYFLQVIIKNLSLIQLINKCSFESLIKIQGILVNRKDKANTKYGFLDNYEVIAKKIKIINYAKELPFSVNRPININEKNINKYPYLWLRKPSKFLLIKQKFNVKKIINKFFWKHNFIDVDTPILSYPTYEGAEEFLIPYIRQKQNLFGIYALSQSPQIYKQLLINGGIMKYFQLAHCFRNEDLRSDRQFEFIQLDVELAFSSGNKIIKYIEKLIQLIWKKILNINIKIPFQRINYFDALHKYGSDHPDLRYDIVINEFTKYNEFKNNYNIKNFGLFSPIFLNKSEKENIYKIANNIKDCKIFFLKIIKNKIIAQNYFSSNFIDKINLHFENYLNKYPNGDLIVFEKKWNNLGDEIIFFTNLGQIRKIILTACAKLFKVNSNFQFNWIINFPLFLKDKATNMWKSTHHPFTAPKKWIYDKNGKLNFNLISSAYDLIINGVEIGGGSERIYKSKLQKLIFQNLGFSEQIINNKFSFLLSAMDYGMPKSAGIAIGLDRLLMILNNCDSIRDVNAFYKSQNGHDPIINLKKCDFQIEINKINMIMNSIKKEKK